VSAGLRAWGRIAAACCAALFVGGLPAAAGAPSIFDFDDWMQRIDDDSQDLQRRIAARDSKAAAASARELEELYGLMEDYFGKRRESADAVRFSREGREYARATLRALAAGKFVAARRNALGIAHGCRDCHHNYKPL
jgi:hypothetical protein